MLKLTERQSRKAVLKGESAKRANPTPVSTLKMLGIRLHRYSEPSFSVEKKEVLQTLDKLKSGHDEETNEVYNLMACKIGQRQQERVNLFEVDTGEKMVNNLIGEGSTSQIRSVHENIHGMCSISEGESEQDLVRQIEQISPPGIGSPLGCASPPKIIDMAKERNPKFGQTNTLYASAEQKTPIKVTQLRRKQVKPNVIYMKDTRDKLILMTEKTRDQYPVDLNGYYGGLSPESKPGEYKNSQIHKKAQELDKKLAEDKRREIEEEKRRQANEEAGVASASSSSYRQLLSFNQRAPNERRLSSLMEADEKKDQDLDRKILDVEACQESLMKQNSSTLSSQNGKHSRQNSIQRRQSVNLTGYRRGAANKAKERESFKTNSQCDYGFGSAVMQHQQQQTEGVDNEMYLPYWQRKVFKSYKHIKVLNKNMHGNVETYTELQINKSEKQLVNEALQFKTKLKNLDCYPVNAVDARQMIRSSSNEQSNMASTFNKVRGSHSIPMSPTVIVNNSVAKQEHSARGEFIEYQPGTLSDEHRPSNINYNSSRAGKNLKMARSQTNFFSQANQAYGTNLVDKQLKPTVQNSHLTLKKSNLNQNSEAELANAIVNEMMGLDEKSFMFDNQKTRAEQTNLRTASTRTSRQVQINLLRQETAKNMDLVGMKPPGRWEIQKRLQLNTTTQGAKSRDQATSQSTLHTTQKRMSQTRVNTGAPSLGSTSRVVSASGPGRNYLRITSNQPFANHTHPAEMRGDDPDQCSSPVARMSRVAKNNAQISKAIRPMTATQLPSRQNPRLDDPRQNSGSYAVRRFQAENTQQFQHDVRVANIQNQLNQAIQDQKLLTIQTEKEKALKSISPKSQPKYGIPYRTQKDAVQDITVRRALVKSPKTTQPTSATKRELTKKRNLLQDRKNSLPQRAAAKNQTDKPYEKSQVKEVKMVAKVIRKAPPVPKFAMTKPTTPKIAEQQSNAGLASFVHITRDIISGVNNNLEKKK